MTRARRSATHSQYGTYLTAWFLHCRSHNLNPTQSSLQEAVNFLETLRTTRNLGYSAMNTARSALSSILNGPDGKPFGQHQLVKTYLRGVFNIKPPMPKYTAIWDADIVLNLLKSYK